MVVPIYDHSPFRWRTPPVVTWLLIGVNFTVYVLQLGISTETMNIIDYLGGVIPSSFTEVAISPLPTPLTLITYTFLHANFLHLFGNMLFLWVFGDDIEVALGHGRFLAFYLASGAGSGLSYVLSDSHSSVVLVGASGAVAGVIAAYLMFRPCAKVTVLVSLVPLRIAAYWVIGFWVIWQFVEVAVRTEDGVAYWAHIGGLATGAVLFLVMRPPGVALFECMQPDSVPADERR